MQPSIQSNFRTFHHPRKKPCAHQHLLPIPCRENVAGVDLPASCFLSPDLPHRGLTLPYFQRVSSGPTESHPKPHGVIFHPNPEWRSTVDKAQHVRSKGHSGLRLQMGPASSGAQQVCQPRHSQLCGPGPQHLQAGGGDCRDLRFAYELVCDPVTQPGSLN